jgi:hypothetical protein
MLVSMPARAPDVMITNGMTTGRHKMANSIRELRALEGQQVFVALTNGSRIDDCNLVSAGRGQVGSLWVFTSGGDLFIPFADVVEVWPAPFTGRRSAA